MNNKKMSLLTILSLVLVVTYCDSNYFGRSLTRTSSLPPDSTDSTPINTPDGADANKDYFSVVNNYDLQPITASIAADIVFVLDRSGSMGDNVEALKNSLTGWFTELDTLGLPNYCVGLIAAVSTTEAGNIVAANGHKCFCRDTMSVAQIQSNFSAAVAAAPTGNGGSTSEDGLYAIHRALTTKLTANQTGGECFTNDKALVIIPMSDEQDVGLSTDGTGCSGTAIKSDGTSVALNTVVFDNSFSKYGTGNWSTTPSSTAFNPNDCSEAKERLNKYVDPTPVGGKYVNTITPQTIADEIFDYNGSLPTFGNSIGYPAGPNPVFGTSAEGPYHGGIEYSEIMGQDMIDLAIAVPGTQAQFNTKMNAMANDLVTQLSFQRVFDLVNSQGQAVAVCAGLEDSLVVKKNGTALAPSKYTLSANRRKVTIKPTVSLHTGDDIKFTFTICVN